MGLQASNGMDVGRKGGKAIGEGSSEPNSHPDILKRRLPKSAQHMDLAGAMVNLLALESS